MSWFFSDPTPQNATDAGRWALSFFHNKAIYYSGYNVTLDQLISKVGGKHASIFVEGLGKAILAAEMSEYQVREAMENLATQAAGRIPADQHLFFEALQNRVLTFTARDWANEAPGIIGDSALDVAKGAAELGNAAIDIGKTLAQFGPVLIVAAVIFIGYARTKQLAGK